MGIVMMGAGKEKEGVSPPELEEGDAALDPPAWPDNWAKPIDGGLARNTE